MYCAGNVNEIVIITYLHVGCEVAIQVDSLGPDNILNHEVSDDLVDHKKRFDYILPAGLFCYDSHCDIFLYYAVHLYT